MKNTPFLAAFAALLLPLSVFAQATGGLATVIASGTGDTVDSAKKDAYRAAVEQVVGTIIDADTLVENDELIKDKVLTYSAAYVEGAEVVGEPERTADGLVRVKIRARVRKTALEEKLTAAKLVSVAIDGESLWAQAVSAQDNLANAEAMIKDVLAKHIACVVAEPVPGKTGKSPLDYDPKTGEVFANVRVRIDQTKYTQFVKEVLGKLGPMAEQKEKLLSQGQREDYLADGYFYYKFQNQ